MHAWCSYHVDSFVIRKKVSLIALSSSCTIIFYSGNIREIILYRSANETNSQDIIGILLEVVFNTNNHNHVRSGLFVCIWYLRNIWNCWTGYTIQHGLGQFTLNKQRGKAVSEKRKLTQTRLYKYNLFNNFKYSL